MAITYDAPSKTITVTGYSAVTPCTWIDIYNAIVAGGWEVGWWQGGISIAQLALAVKIQIGDGSTATYFKDVGKSIIFLHGIVTGWGQSVILVKSNAIATFGYAYDEANKITQQGCDFLFADTSYGSNITADVGGTLDFYSCTFKSNLFSKVVYARRMWNCMIKPAFINWIDNPSYDGYNNFTIGKSEGSGSAARPAVIGASIVGSRAMGVAFGLHLENYPSGNNIDAFDFWLRGVSNFAVGAYPSAGYYARCIDFDAPGITDNGGGHAGYVYKSARLNLKVLDSNNNPLQNAKVSLRDKNGAGFTDTLTDVNGSIVEKIVNYWRHLSAVAGETLSPFTLKIELAGYETYNSVFTFPIWTKINWQIGLKLLIPDTDTSRNPVILADNVFDDAVLTATSTDADPQYNVYNLRDRRSFTFWKAGNTTTPMYITGDRAVAKEVNFLGIYKHNLGSIGASISVEGSDDGFAADIVEILAPFSPPADKPIMKSCTLSGKIDYRIKINGILSAAPKIAWAAVGMNLLFLYPSDPMNFINEGIEGDVNFSNEGMDLGAIVSYNENILEPEFSNFPRAWVTDFYKPFWDNYGKKMKRFLYAPNLVDFPDIIHWARFKKGARFQMPLTTSVYVDKLKLDMESTTEE